MLNSAEHEISNPHKNINKFSFLKAQVSLECYYFLLINVKMPRIIGILTFMSRKNFIIGPVELSMNNIYNLGARFASIMIQLFVPAE